MNHKYEWWAVIKAKMDIFYKMCAHDNIGGIVLQWKYLIHPNFNHVLERKVHWCKMLSK